MIDESCELPLWCVVQADGDRTQLTTRGPVPIQYWSSQESPAMIQRSLHRALCIARPQRIVATVAEGHRKWWSDPLWCVAKGRRIVDELSGRPTVTLVAALALIERAAGRNALVVLQPADRFCASQDAFIAGVRRAIQTLERLPGHVVTLTLDACASEPGQDYLLLGAEDAILHELWPDLVADARARTWMVDEEVPLPARMPGTRFCRPWRHTWVQRPLPRLRAVAVDDCGFSSSAMRTASERAAQTCH